MSDCKKVSGFKGIDLRSVPKLETVIRLIGGNYDIILLELK
jgi:hypothetical protein